MYLPTAALLMFGHSHATGVQRLVQDARLAATEDLVQRLSRLPWDRIIFCSNEPDVLVASGVAVERVRSTTEPFHFGREVQSIVQRCGLENHGILYLGGGLPLVTADTLEQMRQFLVENDAAVITNNLHSSDFAAWVPGALALRILPPDTDNDLAWQLRRCAELVELPRSAETVFDIDTPTDMMLLHLATGLGPNVRALLERKPVGREDMLRVLEVLRSFEKTVLCYGRLSHHSWAYFAQRAACQTRIISEERGMRASGRLARGEVRSLLGYLADQSGFTCMFRILSELADALILDTRVLMAHCRQWPSAADRFHSDLGQVEAIHDSWLKRMTQAALECGVPVLFGGHCLVSGGLYLLGEAVGPKEYPSSEGDLNRLQREHLPLANGSGDTERRVATPQA